MAIYSGSLCIIMDPDWILLIAGSGSEKTKSLLNLMSNQPDIDKTCLYAKVCW